MKPKHVIVIDFETYYDSEYSLSNIPTAEYINSPKFEVIGYAVKIDDKPTKWVPAAESGDNLYLAPSLQMLPWEESLCVAHNAMFDGSILEWVYGVHPAKYFCTWQAAWPAIGPFVKSTSLANCAEFLKLGKKGTEVHDAKGKHKADFTPDELAAYAQYCVNDVELTYKLYRVLNGWFRGHNRNVV
jgi:DNA polymerase